MMARVVIMMAGDILVMAAHTCHLGQGVPWCAMDCTSGMKAALLVVRVGEGSGWASYRGPSMHVIGCFTLACQIRYSLHGLRERQLWCN